MVVYSNCSQQRPEIKKRQVYSRLRGDSFNLLLFHRKEALVCPYSQPRLSLYWTTLQTPSCSHVCGAQRRPGSCPGSAPTSCFHRLSTPCCWWQCLTFNKITWLFGHQKSRAHHVLTGVSSNSIVSSLGLSGNVLSFSLGLWKGTVKMKQTGQEKIKEETNLKRPIHTLSRAIPVCFRVPLIFCLNHILQISEDLHWQVKGVQEGRASTISDDMQLIVLTCLMQHCLPLGHQKTFFRDILSCRSIGCSTTSKIQHSKHRSYWYAWLRKPLK